MLGRNFTCWKVRAIPGLRNAPLPGAGNVLTEENDPAVVALERASDEVEYRAFACAVRSDQADDFACFNLESDAADGFKSAETLEQTARQ